MKNKFKVGDKMPEPISEVMGSSEWGSPSGEIFGKFEYHDENLDGVIDMFRVYRQCKGEKIYFGQFDGKKLYLDINPNDSYIDEIVPVEDVGLRQANDDAPDCTVVL